MIHEAILIGDIPFVITDTAYPRDGRSVEKIGVERSLSAAESADLILFLRDASKDLDDDEAAVIGTLDRNKTIFIANKIR